MAARGTTPAVAVVLLVFLTVACAVAVTAAVPSAPERPPQATFAAEADAAGELRVTHLGGDAVDPASLVVRVRVDGTPLAEQPPVPFFAARGFESGPTGAFNSATAGDWTAGETASLRVAATNSPAFDPGATVEVRLYAGDTPLATLETTVEPR